MTPLMRKILTEARGLAERARVAPRVLWQTGMVREATAPGVLSLLRSFRRPNPSQLLRYHARNTPHRTALIYRDRRYSFYALDRRIERLAVALRSSGVRAGDAVALALQNVPEQLILQAAIGRLGGSAVTVSWRSTADELRYLLDDSGARALFFNADHAEPVRGAVAGRGDFARRCYAIGGEAEGLGSYQALLDGVAPDAQFEVRGDDGEQAAVIIYTSGTTGKPKGAVRRFKQDVVAAVLGFIGETPMRAGQTHLAVCPLYHSTAFGFTSLSYVLGSTVVLLDRFEPLAVLRAIERYRVDHTALVPTMLHRLLELGPEVIARHDTSSLKAIFTGGAPLPGPLALRVMDTLGDVLYQFYGATETGLVTLAKPADMRAAPTTIGCALPGNDIRLVGEDGREVPTGEVGELYVLSGNLVDGYHNNAAATGAATLEGAFSVGDLARRDAHARYFIEGRKRDMIISGGVNVYPREVEELLLRHPEVAEVAVVGVPDQEWGERVHAFIVAERACEPGEALVASLRDLARERLAGPKRPRGYSFVDELPRNPTGKVLKRQLVARVANEAEPSR